MMLYGNNSNPIGCSLLRGRHYLGFLTAAFFGSLNDSCFKMMVSLLVLNASTPTTTVGNGFAAAGAVFALPFLMLAGYAGQAADRWSKVLVLQVAKAAEVVIVGLGLLVVSIDKPAWTLGVLFLLGVKGAFFSPAQSGVLPEVLPKRWLGRANSLLFFLSFTALVIGPVLASDVFEFCLQQRWKCALPLAAFALIGWIGSLVLPFTQSSLLRQQSRWNWNPFAHIPDGLRELRCIPKLQAPVLATAYFWFVGAILQITILLFCVERLHTNNLVTGYLLGILSLGLGLGSLLAGLLLRENANIGIVPFAGCLLAGLCFLMSNIQDVPSTSILVAAIGTSGGLFIVPPTALLQYYSERSRRGRLLATTNFANMLGIILASAVFWLLHAALGLTSGAILATEGSITLGMSIFIFKWSPEPSLRLLLTGLLRVMFRIKIFNAENIPSQGGALLIANHVSFADAFVLSCAVKRPIRFLMLRQYFEVPALKWLFKLFRVIPISNGRPSKASVGALNEAGKSIVDGELVCIFPEGRRTRTGSLESFQRGIERIAQLAPGLPVIPVYLNGLWGIPSSFKEEKTPCDYLMIRKRVSVNIGHRAEGLIETKSLQALLQELAPQTRRSAATITLDEETQSRPSHAALVLDSMDLKQDLP